MQAGSWIYYWLMIIIMTRMMIEQKDKKIDIQERNKSGVRVKCNVNLVKVIAEEK